MKIKISLALFLLLSSGCATRSTQMKKAKEPATTYRTPFTQGTNLEGFQHIERISHMSVPVRKAKNDDVYHCVGAGGGDGKKLLVQLSFSDGNHKMVGATVSCKVFLENFSFVGNTAKKHCQFESKPSTSGELQIHYAAEGETVHLTVTCSSPTIKGEQMPFAGRVLTTYPTRTAKFSIHRSKPIPNLTVYENTVHFNPQLTRLGK